MSSIDPKAATFLEHARTLVDRKRDAIFATWYNEQGQATQDYSFGRLWAEAGVIAYFLRVKWGLKKGDKVVLCYDFGLHFFAVFIGCLRAGVIPVLVYPPAPPLTKSLPKLASAVRICSPVLILADSRVGALKKIDELNPLSKSRLLWPAGLSFKCTDTLPFHNAAGACSQKNNSTWKQAMQRKKPKDSPESYTFDEPTIGPDDTAFLQFTSGSTSDPKGVVVTHKNLISNARLYLGAFERHGTVKGDGWIGCTWLPQYHDMGLLSATIYPFCGGWRQHCMSPITFIKNPLLWLKIMSDNNANWGIAPDFSYRLCARKFLDAKKAGIEEPIPNLDLSKIWKLQNAAEPIRIETVRLFEDTFTPYGLPPAKHCLVGVYGIAEMVVAVSYTLELQLSNLREGEDAAPYVAIGKKGMFHESITIKIVDPQTLQEAPDNTTGEIWIAGSSVAGGYYGRPDLTQQSFGARIRDPNGMEILDSPAFLRTGDLGFFQEDHLYICGRQKDLIIVQGVNYYPQDTEDAVQEASPAVRPGCVAAFSTNETGGDGDLQIVFEIRKNRENDAAAVCEDVKQAVLSKIGLVPSVIVAVAQGTISKTTSGKIQRRANRARLNSGGHVVVHSVNSQPVPPTPNNLQPREGDPDKPHVELGESATAAALFDAALVDVLGEKVDASKTWDENGLTSVMMVELSNRLAAIGIVVPSNFPDLYAAPILLKHHVLQDQTNAFPLKLPQLPQPASRDREIAWSYATILQAFGAVAVLLLVATSLIPAYFFVTANITKDLPFLLPLMVPVWYLSLTFELIAIKWIVIGRYTAKEISVPSIAFVQWWFIDNFVRCWEIWVGNFLRGTPLITVVYNLLGASIHPSASIDCFIREFDLVTVGAESSCEQQPRCRKFSPWEEQGLSLRFRPVSVGMNCTVAGHLEPGVSIGDRCHVENLSAVAEGSQVPPAAMAIGSPARQGQDAATENANPHWLAIGCSKVALLFVQLYLSAGLFMVANLSIPFGILDGFRYGWLVHLFLVLPVYTVLSLATTIALKWILIGKRRPGPVPLSWIRNVSDWFADYNYRLSILVFELVAANSIFGNLMLMTMGQDIDLNSKVWLFLFPPSQLDLVTVRNSFLSFESFRTCPGSGKEYQAIRIENSSIGHSTFIEGGAVIESERIHPLSFVPSTHRSPKKPSEERSLECAPQPGALFWRKAWCDVFAVFYAITILLSTLPTIEVWKGLETLEFLSSGVGSFVVKIFCAIIVQTASLWVCLSLGYFLFSPRTSQHSLSLAKNAREMGAYAATLSFQSSVEAWSFVHVLWGSKLYNPLIRFLGANVGQDVLYFGDAMYDCHYLTFSERTVVDSVSVVCGHAGVKEGFILGETRLSGVVLHPGVIALSNTQHHSSTSQSSVGPVCFMAPSARVGGRVPPFGSDETGYCSQSEAAAESQEDVVFDV
ncbi:Putative fatty-acid--CoA ligase FadD21 [Seminavis robusta]|uniref:Fatty-acid--CoA ligase FadD21 n=1 Tax=Seminavis robusta TaxID=568900 RepID=A0A9N8D8T7_9STRA|nr:Putative fatty-acid--CoA ligase FadD21 [Seminavis robusta]|eukprot:Sro33_g021690.1 Putative fatty-acid--CoA ligase FadD21 (1434) ;mRNA; f:138266-142653